MALVTDDKDSSSCCFRVLGTFDYCGSSENSGDKVVNSCCFMVLGF